MSLARSKRFHTASVWSSLWISTDRFGGCGRWWSRPELTLSGALQSSRASATTLTLKATIPSDRRPFWSGNLTARSSAFRPRRC